jgi:replicative DNA helicase
MTEKRLPQNIEAEESVLGSLIIDPEAITLLEDALRPDDFYRDAHKTLYQAMLTLSARREPADFVTLCDELERSGTLADVGGASAIASLMNGVPTSANAVYYGRIVAQKALYRRLIRAAGQIAALAYEESDDALEGAEQLIFLLGQAQGNGSDLTPLQEVLSDCMTALDGLHERRTSIIGVPTGYRHLDAPLGGLQRSDLVILAARPGTGKTSFALGVARNACQAGFRVALFSLEMSRRQLGMRLLSMEAGIDQHRLRLGRVEDHEWEQVVAALGILSEGHLWIDDSAALSLASLRSRARRAQARHGVDLVIVDYLQLMRASLDGKRFQNREQEIAEISRGLKALAKELDVPVLALAQLSRAVEVRASKVPQLSDLRESGSIENEADVVLFIYRDDLYNAESEAAGTADLIIAKHRNGPTGTVRLGFDPTQTCFYTLETTEATREAAWEKE